MAAFELSSNVTDCEMHCYVYLCVHINGWLRGSEGMAHTGQHLIVVGAYAYVRLRHPLRSVPVEGLGGDRKII